MEIYVSFFPVLSRFPNSFPRLSYCMRNSVPSNPENCTEHLASRIEEILRSASAIPKPTRARLTLGPLWGSKILKLWFLHPPSTFNLHSTPQRVFECYIYIPSILANWIRILTVFESLVNASKTWRCLPFSLIRPSWVSWQTSLLLPSINSRLFRNLICPNITHFRIGCWLPKHSSLVQSNTWN